MRARAGRVIIAGTVCAAVLIIASGAANAEPPPDDPSVTSEGEMLAPEPPWVEAVPADAPVALPTPMDPFGPPPVPPAGTSAGQNAIPFTGPPPFLPPSVNPRNASTVGVAKPIIITFQRAIADRSMAEQAIRISSNPPVPGKFYWMSDTQVRWRPQDFWPANSTVTVDAAGAKTTFRVGDALVATIDDRTHQMEVMRNGVLEKTFPVSLGKKGYETPNGTYYVLEKFADMVMDSSTYGVPIDSAEGYKLNVKDAVRISNTGIFVHGAPWSVADQGKRNVSHGCPNLSPANAQWFFDNFGSGDPVVVKNSVGIYNQNDGAQDWQI